MLGARRTTFTIACILAARLACAQSGDGQVLDQTGLALPGATVQLFDGPSLVTTVATDSQGHFSLDQRLKGDSIAVSLSGFETVRVSRAAIKRIVLALEHASDSTTVLAPTLAPSTVEAPLLGHALTAANIARMPSAHMKARESLPLLPSVVRGPDGLMQLGGAPAHETPLLLDGFNIADPASGISSLNLPLEAVRGVEALRDPMSVSYGGLLGGLVALESKPGSDELALGVQGFVPRLARYAPPNFGGIEGVFPRAYVSGGRGRVHFTLASEYDYERIPVPGVTVGREPDLIEESSITFSRVDVDASARHHLTLEALVFPGDTRSVGLSPLRDESATTDLNQRDAFGGIVERFVPDAQDVFTVRIGVLQHDTRLQPKGSGVSVLTPAGWTANWFASASRVSRRYGATLTWERIARADGRPHDVTMTAEIGGRSLSGRIHETAIAVRGPSGRVVRTVDFGGASQVSASDRPLALAVHDGWQISDRLTIDGGARVDHSRYGGAAPSARAAVRVALDRSGTTVLKAGAGTFVGSLPLAAPAFAGQAVRTDRAFDDVGALIREDTWTPAASELRAPQAFAVTAALERQIVPGLDAQAAVTDRRSSRLATLDVPDGSGLLTVSSTGTGRYREAQFSIRRTWRHDQQLFVSYVRSAAHGELNDFETLFQAVDAPLVQRGGQSRSPGDAPHRLLAWATVDLPRKLVVSPVVEWRSGFPYSVVDARYNYVGTPNSRRYPTFFATDMVVYKTFTVHDRSADLGLQLFNVTNHRNPRDVYAVSGAPGFGSFTNSVGPIVRGYMLLKW